MRLTRRSRLAAAAAAAGLTAATLVGAGPASAQPSSGHGAHRPTRFLMHEYVDHATESYTFTATAPLCPAGSFRDAVTVVARNHRDTVEVWRVRTTYTCADGSGTFAATKHLVRFQGSDWAYNKGWVRFTGGTGTYTGLTGQGRDVGASHSGQGAGVIVGRLRLPTG